MFESVLYLALLFLRLVRLLSYRFYRSQKLWQKSLSGFSILALLAAWLVGRYSLIMGATMLIGATGFAFALSQLLEKGETAQTIGEKIRRGLISLGFILITALHLFFSYTVFNPDFITRHTNVFFGLTAVSEKESSQTQNSDGSVYYRDLSYPSNFGSNKLDIYTTSNAKGTIFYIHGGGYAGDDKFYREDYLLRYVKDGYNVVNVNYLLSPKAHYPDGLIQVDEALAYIVQNAEKYGLDSSKIVLSGDSAGGQLAGQLALVLTNKDYAKQIDFTPLSTITPVAYIGVSSWSDIQDGLSTGWAIFDWVVAPISRSYFQVLDVKQAPIAKEASILKHVDQHFPPSFISDGNFGSFTSSNTALVDRLHQLGVEVDSQFYDKDEAKLGHIFELDLTNLYAQEVYSKQLAFLERILK